MLDEEPWSEDEHACFVQALQEQSGSINWHVTAHRIGTKSAQQVRNFLAVSACCLALHHSPALPKPRRLSWSAVPTAVPCRRLKPILGPSRPHL